MKHTLLLTLALMLAVGIHAADDLYYGIYKGSGTLTGIGTGKAETYDLALHLSDPSLVGTEIHALRVPINQKATNASGYQVWLSKELNVASNVNVPDVTSIDFEPNAAWVEVTLAEPYVIPEGGVYVGYSFSVSSVDATNASDANRKPIQAVASDEIDGLYIHANRTYRKWTQLSRSTLAGQGAFALTVVLRGDRVFTNAASITAPDELTAYALTGQQQTFTYTIVNHGTANITSIDYDLTFNGHTEQHHATLNLRGTYYGRQTTLRVTTPAADVAATLPLTVSITKVNGEPNQDLSPATTIDIACIATLPKHKPLLEEYTGTWCQYCTRGTAAMIAMNDRHGDDFVGVAYHNGDSMQVYSAAVLPNNPEGYPHAYIDRVVDTDPYFGTSGANLGIEQDWLSRQNLVAPAALGLSARWTNDAHTGVEVTASANFIRNLANNPFRFAYILIADDLSGKGNGWNQQNAYSGNTGYANDPYMGPFTRMPGVIENYNFQEVVISISSAGKDAIAESLPKEVAGNVDYTHTYTFDLSTSRLKPLSDKLHAVAVLVNTLTGEVANAEKVAIGETNAVRDVASPAVGVTYTDLSGRPVAAMRGGVYVRTVRHADGSTTSTKVANVR